MAPSKLDEEKPDVVSHSIPDDCDSLAVGAVRAAATGPRGDGKITLNDKKAKLEELKEGFLVKVTLDDKFVVTKIDAKSRK
ncbi:hypothetical protein [Gimesia maris]|uniref:hypothetical protein n=1 Tax=Gimesia maris TaxID=122 RepID=UPI0030DD12A2